MLTLRMLLMVTPLLTHCLLSLTITIEYWHLNARKKYDIIALSTMA